MHNDGKNGLLSSNLSLKKSINLIYYELQLKHNIHKIILSKQFIIFVVLLLYMTLLISCYHFTYTCYILWMENDC